MTTKPYRVLVVDDNPRTAQSLAWLLIDAGYDVREAYCGDTALAILERFHPDVCILDITMHGMNGYELASRIRESTLDQPPLLATMTGLGGCDHLDRAVAAGFDLHFSKPTNLADLIDQLECCLRRTDCLAQA